MKIEKIVTLYGPNTFSHNPVLVMTLALEDLAGKESYEVPGFVGRLTAALPGIREHHCGLGRPGGFIERLNGGTYFGHIVEHVALELTDAVGISVNRGKTVSTEREGVYRVGVEFRSEAGMRALLRVAVDYVQALVEDVPYPIEEHLVAVRAEVSRTDLGPSTASLLNAAIERNIPWRRLNEDSLIQLGYGTRYCETLRLKHSTGATVAGTSAGASVVSETMLVEGPGDNSHRVGDSLRMAPGLGLLQGIIIDQHFAERGRVGRLIGAVAQNPRLLGVGIDENTAIVLHADSFSVIGCGAVYVVDGSRMNYTNVSETKPEITLAAHNLKLDLLSSGDVYDLAKRAASCPESQTVRAGAGNGRA